MTAPEFFQRVRDAAAKRWDQLENDPDLAAPWHQLFKQVQNPRHVLSELLQNADDVGATEASAYIEDGIFVFKHNGRDFSEEDFASLCRFGYSNKRSLHTIGFRGIGFKSTFSLGDSVELYTPTLALSFEQIRFTQPIWLGSGDKLTSGTQIRVKVKDPHRLHEAASSLKEWSNNAVSLLFFKNIRRIKVADQDIHWRSLGDGPIPESEWVTRDDNADTVFLLARSEAEGFPVDAIDEIEQERLLDAGSRIELPPCSVEIVLGETGELFVVLPTGVLTSMAFAANAPFIQDPARLGIKDPEISPTNRWLLQRIGHFAGYLMLEWLANTSLNASERAQAYDLLPAATEGAFRPAETSVSVLLRSAFNKTIDERPHVLTQAAVLVGANGAVSLPDAIMNTWSPEESAALFDREYRPPLSSAVASDNRNKLVVRESVYQVTRDDVLDVLKRKPLQKPESWNALLCLWSYVAEDLRHRWYLATRRDQHIVPVQGKDILYPAKDVVRLAESKLLQSDVDWQFLSTYLVVLNQNWTRFLAERRRLAQDSTQGDVVEVEDAYSLLRALHLDETSDASHVVGQVAAAFFKSPEPISRCVQLAQIAAKLTAASGDEFRFVTRDKMLRPAAGLIFDEFGVVDDLLPGPFCAEHVLHRAYDAPFTSCTREEWRRWVSDERSALGTFVTPIKTERKLWDRTKVVHELRTKGCDKPPTYPFVSDVFIVEDWDFEACHWEHWQQLALNDAAVYARVAEQVLKQTNKIWTKTYEARLLQRSKQRTNRPITDETLISQWILKLRELPCLRDTRGALHKPAELMRRTELTEPFMDVEPFVHASLDTESARELLDLLGLQSEPTGPERILNRLRALAQSEEPPTGEVDKWYRRLDAILLNASTQDVINMRRLFQTEKLVLSESSGWMISSAVYLRSDDNDVPGAAIVRNSVSDLALWTRIGVAERPTFELVIHWLIKIPTGERLRGGELRTVRALLARHPARIWSECRHWLNLLGEWAPVTELNCALTMASLIPWTHLHDWVKRQTADLKDLSADALASPPLLGLPTLAALITDQIYGAAACIGALERRGWICELAENLMRVDLEDISETRRVRALATDLSRTQWQKVSRLEVMPYVNGTPAGTSRHAEVQWIGNVLYVEDKSAARLARATSSELGRVFARDDVTDAIKTCFERDADFIHEYVDQNFKLSASLLDPEDVGTKEASGKRSVERPDPLGSDSAVVIVSEKTRIDEGSAKTPDPSAEERDRSMVGRVHRHAGEIKPGVFERYALRAGFRKESDHRFIRDDGTSCSKVSAAIFPWEVYSASGDLTMRYWPQEHCINNGPLQINAEMWEMMHRDPDATALILVDENDEPTVFKGSTIVEMVDQGKVTIHPSSYRLVYHS